MIIAGQTFWVLLALVAFVAVIAIGVMLSGYGNCCNVCI